MKSIKKYALALLGSAVLAFGMYNIHAQSNITEGGILGLGLLFRHWFGISPAVTTAVLSAVCYFFGFRVLGRSFVLMSAVSCAGYSVFYAVCELFPPLWPEIAAHPLIASVAGAAFIGVGAGLAVRAGGAPSGDDALAMALSRLAHVRIERIYLLSDLVVLALSLTYIPVRRIAYSLLTVVLSGQIIGLMQRIPLRKRPGPPDDRS